MSEKYDVIIGLEVHIQSLTNSKMFCSCDARYFQKEQNTLVCPVCMGLPGALPVPNKRAIELCILLGLATGCDIESEIRFDRKHYFYPDLPKGYQISQYDQPICSDGEITIRDKEGENKVIEIERIHQEEDVAKSTHHTDVNGEYTLVDYNKSGVALIEIVSKPVINSAAEAKEYCAKLRQITRYLGVSDADMEKGQMRCEPNISVQEKGRWEYKDEKILPIGDYKLNPKVEIKNIGSISAVEKSIEYEVSRIIDDLEAGREIKQQTRGWDPEKGETIFQRSKESAEDYRYFPDPDIPIIEVTQSDIERISEQLTELPDIKVARYITEYGLSEYDAGVLTSERKTAEFFEDLVNQLEDKNMVKDAVNWLTGHIFALSKAKGIAVYELGMNVQDLASLISASSKKEININKAREILTESIEKSVDLNHLLNENLGSIVSDVESLTEVAQKVLGDNQQAVEDYKAGKESVIMYLVGQVMKETKGNAQPEVAKNILIELLQ